jgi:hypothetical protein
MYQPVQNLYHEQVHQPCTKPVQNMYHEQVHQPCTKLVQITCHNNLSKQPITTTCLINIINQIKYTHQDQHQDSSQRCASTNHNTTTHNHHQDQYVLLIYQYKYATSSINHVSTILLTSASNHVPSMYQSCINYSSICTNIINYTPHVCANSSTTCLNHVRNMYLNQNPSSISSSKYDL